MPTFTAQDDIFANEQVLTEQYDPYEMPEREDELEQFNVPLMPAARGSQPGNIFVYGGTGAGKSEATRMKLQELKNDTESIDGVTVQTVWQNCQDMTAYDVATYLVNSFRDYENHMGKGYATRRVLNELWREIEETDATHMIVVLDEVDALGTDDSLLYHLSRPDTIKEIDTCISVIGTCNNSQYYQNLSARVESSLCQREIRFDAYDADQLRAILRSRADKAFHADVLADDVIPLTSARAAQDTGSARHALDVLLEAGRRATSDGSDQVTGDHVRKAFESVEDDRIISDLRGMHLQKHVVLASIVRLMESGKEQFSRTDVYEKYKSVADKAGAQTKTQRTVHSRLSDLSLEGFLERHEYNNGLSGGRRYEYSLTVDTDNVIDALDDQPRFRELLNP